MPNRRDTLKAATADRHPALERTAVLRAFASADATPACPIAWDQPHSAAEAPGTMYVLEGATLGLRQSVCALPATHPARGPADRFVQGYGEHTGTRWQAFPAQLAAVASVCWPQVVTGAVAAFRCFETHFSSGPWRDFESRRPCGSGGTPATREWLS